MSKEEGIFSFNVEVKMDWAESKGYNKMFE
jgi:hypothetical protein